MTDKEKILELEATNKNLELVCDIQRTEISRLVKKSEYIRREALACVEQALNVIKDLTGEI